jgi:hypothetical protein
VSWRRRWSYQATRGPETCAPSCRACSSSRSCSCTAVRSTCPHARYREQQVAAPKAKGQSSHKRGGAHGVARTHPHPAQRELQGRAGQPTAVLLPVQHPARRHRGLQRLAHLPTRARPTPRPRALSPASGPSQRPQKRLRHPVPARHADGLAGWRTCGRLRMSCERAVPTTS